MEAEEQKILNEKAVRELCSAYKRLFQTEDGKVVFDDLERFCGFLNTSVSEQNPNALQTMYLEGKRRVFLRINGMLKVKENKND